MLKHIAPLIFLAFVSFSSCKKDHNCECILDGETITTVYKNISSSEAETNCTNQNQIYQLENGSCELN